MNQLTILIFYSFKDIHLRIYMLQYLFILVNQIVFTGFNNRLYCAED